MGEGKPTILVVDDEPIVVDMVQRYLRRDGFRVATATTGPDALTAAVDRERPPSLIVLDVMLPGLDGVEVCRRIDHSTVKVIMLTARDDPALEEACKAAGADAFLTKPFSSITLLDLIEELAA